MPSIFQRRKSASGASELSVSGAAATASCRQELEITGRIGGANGTNQDANMVDSEDAERAKVDIPRASAAVNATLTDAEVAELELLEAEAAELERLDTDEDRQQLAAAHTAAVAAYNAQQRQPQCAREARHDLDASHNDNEAGNRHLRYSDFEGYDGPEYEDEVDGPEYEDEVDDIDDESTAPEPQLQYDDDFSDYDDDERGQDAVDGPPRADTELLYDELPTTAMGASDQTRAVESASKRSAERCAQVFRIPHAEYVADTNDATSRQRQERWRQREQQCDECGDDGGQYGAGQDEYRAEEYGDDAYYRRIAAAAYNLDERQIGSGSHAAETEDDDFGESGNENEHTHGHEEYVYEEYVHDEYAYDGNHFDDHYEDDDDDEHCYDETPSRSGSTDLGFPDYNGAARAAARVDTYEQLGDDVRFLPGSYESYDYRPARPKPTLVATGPPRVASLAPQFARHRQQPKHPAASLRRAGGRSQQPPPLPAWKPGGKAIARVVSGDSELLGRRPQAQNVDRGSSRARGQDGELPVWNVALKAAETAARRRQRESTAVAVAAAAAAAASTTTSSGGGGGGGGGGGDIGRGRPSRAGFGSSTPRNTSGARPVPRSAAHARPPQAAAAADKWVRRRRELAKLTESRPRETPAFGSRTPTYRTDNIPPQYCHMDMSGQQGGDGSKATVYDDAATDPVQVTPPAVGSIAHPVLPSGKLDAAAIRAALEQSRARNAELARGLQGRLTQFVAKSAVGGGPAAAGAVDGVLKLVETLAPAPAPPPPIVGALKNRSISTKVSVRKAAATIVPSAVVSEQTVRPRSPVPRGVVNSQFSGQPSASGFSTAALVGNHAVAAEATAADPGVSMAATAAVTVAATTSVSPPSVLENMTVESRGPSADAETSHGSVELDDIFKTPTTPEPSAARPPLSPPRPPLQPKGSARTSTTRSSGAVLDTPLACVLCVKLVQAREIGLAGYFEKLDVDGESAGKISCTVGEQRQRLTRGRTVRLSFSLNATTAMMVEYVTTDALHSTNVDLRAVLKGGRSNSWHDLIDDADPSGARSRTMIQLELSCGKNGCVSSLPTQMESNDTAAVFFSGSPDCLSIWTAAVVAAVSV